MSFLRQILFAGLIAFPGASLAQNIVATDATSIANFFLEEGIEPSVEEDNTGDPKINVDYYGTDFSIFYYGCEDGINCDSIQFFSGYRTDGGVRLSKVNEWNSNKRYAFAYVSKEGNARIEHDVFLGKYGMVPDDFAKLLSLWVRAQKEFEEHIEW